MLIFKLLKRHAKNRVHEKQEEGDSPTDSGTPGDHSSEATNSTTQSTSEHHSPPVELRVPSVQIAPTLTDVLAANSKASQQQQFGLPTNIHRQQQYGGANNESDGVYRVPENSTFGGTRFIIGPRSAIANNPAQCYSRAPNRNDRLNSLQI